MAANLTSGTQQSYELSGIHIFQGLAPDVVLIQEFNYAGDRRTLVDTAFGTSFSFYVEPRTGGIPNGVVSRYPIAESGVWVDASVGDRAFVYARLDVPGAVDLWAVSVHLLTTGATQRATEATQLLGYVQGKVPAGDYLVIGGDFNTETTNEQALGTLAPLAADAAPFPADQGGNTNTSINRDHPHDWVLGSTNLEAHATPVTIGAASFPAGLVFDSRVYTPLSDVAPVVAGDSGATGMQHMPVVRDFVVGGAN
jgi:endonuclease/exonuclease/phosphatase family metal-dependent hydrolase